MTVNVLGAKLLYKKVEVEKVAHHFFPQWQEKPASHSYYTSFPLLSELKVIHFYWYVCSHITLLWTLPIVFLVFK